LKEYDNKLMDIKDDNIVYHYTSAKVLHSILKNRELWATDLEYVNDSQEIKYALEKLTEVLIIEIDKSPDAFEVVLRTMNTRPAETMEYMLKILSNLQEYDGVLLDRAYAVCFSSYGDLLSQWRAYGGTDNYSIGFYKNKLNEIMHQFTPSSKPQLVKVRYGIDEEVEHNLKKFVETLKAYSARPGLSALSKYKSELLQILATVKHKAFVEEAEWRLLTTGQPVDELHFRSSNFGNIPYIKLGFPENSIANIRIGPGSNTVLKRQALIQLVNKYAPYIRSAISDSEAPLRR
jgi:hypothetical protein